MIRICLDSLTTNLNSSTSPTVDVGWLVKDKVNLFLHDRRRGERSPPIATAATAASQISVSLRLEQVEVAYLAPHLLRPRTRGLGPLLDSSYSVDVVSLTNYQVKYAILI
jgi:hypothetical protein